MGGIVLPATRQSFDFWAIVLTGCVMAICSVALAAVGVPPFRLGSYAANASFYFLTVTLVEGSLFLWKLLKARPYSPFQWGREYLRERGPFVLRCLPLLLLLTVFMPMFSALKASIPLFAPFTWDRAFIEADRALFGKDAWRVLQPVLGFPVVTSALSFLYHSWLLLIYFGSVFFIYRRDNRYLAAFLPLWIIGGVAMAIGFSSAGPCFVGPLLGDHTFDAQMAYLNAANEQYPVLVLKVQDSLLQWHLSGQHGLGRGITAMPSMHVALACLFWLAIRRVSKWAGWFFGVFYVLIFVGSVHLGYHYAVDGIVATALAVFLWWAAGKVVRCEVT